MPRGGKRKYCNVNEARNAKRLKDRHRQSRIRTNANHYFAYRCAFALLVSRRMKDLKFILIFYLYSGPQIQSFMSTT